MLGTDQVEVLTVQVASLMTKIVEIQVLGERLLMIEGYECKECAILFAYFYHNYHSVIVLLVAGPHQCVIEFWLSKSRRILWCYATQGNIEVQNVRRGREPPFSLPLLYRKRVGEFLGACRKPAVREQKVAFRGPIRDGRTRRYLCIL